MVTPQTAVTAWSRIRCIFGLLPGGDCIIGAQIFALTHPLATVDSSALVSLQSAIKNDADNLTDEVGIVQ